MANNVLLNNVEHKDYRIITDRGAAYGDNIRGALLMPSEYRRVVNLYPIVFRKNPETARFETIALFGFEEKENLFLSEQGWMADYIPMSVERIPFMIGFNGHQSTDESQAFIHLDVDHPKVSLTKGESIFLPHGGNSPFLEKVNDILSKLLLETEQLTEFSKVLTTMDLLEPFTLRVKITDNHGIEMKGFYTINEDKLNCLSGKDLERLQQQGYLNPIFMILASLENIRLLVNKKENLLVT